MSKFNFQRVIENIEQVKRDLPAKLINVAQNYFLDSFKKGSFNDENWQEVQRRIPDTPSYKYAKPKSNRTKPILINTGKLRREVSLLAKNAKITYTANNFIVTMRVDTNVTPYAGYINNGTPKMPKRQFMGDTPELRRRLRISIQAYCNKAFGGSSK